VEHNRAIWKALVDNTNVEPGTDDTVWILLANSTRLHSLRQKAWDTIYGGYLGLKYYANFARNHSKPLILNEWGVWANTHGGFDNDYYIERMHEFIMNDTNNVAIYSYFDVYAHDGDHKLRPVSNFPHSSQKFLELFRVPERTPTDEISPIGSGGETPLSPNESPQAGKPTTPSSLLTNGAHSTLLSMHAIVLLAVFLAFVSN
jgi:hypothetical protein